MFYSFIEIYKELHFKLFLFLYSSVYCFGQVDSNQKINIEMEVDSLINISIYEKAFPGAQIYFKLDDKIIINKSYGFHTYDSLIEVENDHIYDLASLTKVFASTLAIMKISEDYKINLNDPISNYIKDLKPGTNSVCFQVRRSLLASISSRAVVILPVTTKSPSITSACCCQAPPS